MHARCLHCSPMQTSGRSAFTDSARRTRPLVNLQRAARQSCRFDRINSSRTRYGSNWLEPNPFNGGAGSRTRPCRAAQSTVRARRHTLRRACSSRDVGFGVFVMPPVRPMIVRVTVDLAPFTNKMRLFVRYPPSTACIPSREILKLLSVALLVCVSAAQAQVGGSFDTTFGAPTASCPRLSSAAMTMTAPTPWHCNPTARY